MKEKSSKTNTEARYLLALVFKQLKSTSKDRNEHAEGLPRCKRQKH